jgi:hypothetical protein
VVAPAFAVRGYGWCPKKAGCELRSTKRGRCASEQSLEAVHSLAPSRFSLESGNLLYLRQALASRVPSLLTQNLQALEEQVCVPYVQSHALLVVDWLGDMTLKLKRCLPHFRVLKSRRPR